MSKQYTSPSADACVSREFTTAATGIPAATTVNPLKTSPALPFLTKNISNGNGIQSLTSSSSLPSFFFSKTSVPSFGASALVYQAKNSIQYDINGIYRGGSISEGGAVAVGDKFQPTNLHEKNKNLAMDGGNTNALYRYALLDTHCVQGENGKGVCFEEAKRQNQKSHAVNATTANVSNTSLDALEVFARLGMDKQPPKSEVNVQSNTNKFREYASNENNPLLKYALL